MVSRIVLAALLLIPVTASAQQKTLTTTQLCQRLVPYQPSDDVAYKPDADVHGRAVVPADVEGSHQIDMPENIDIAITVDQATKLGLPANIPYRAEAFIGGVSVNKNGDVYFNGKRISETQIQVLCPSKSKGPKYKSRRVRHVAPADLPN